MNSNLYFKLAQEKGNQFLGGGGADISVCDGLITIFFLMQVNAQCNRLSVRKLCKPPYTRY